MTQSATQAHWSRVYSEKDPTSVSWYEPEPEASLRALERCGAGPASSIVDVGGGASTLVDALLARGWRDVTVVDIAAAALKASQARLGSQAEQVHWEVADMTDWVPSRRYDVWHDRAVFHFLTKPEQRLAYRRAPAAAAPTRCALSTCSGSRPTPTSRRSRKPGARGPRSFTRT